MVGIEPIAEAALARDALRLRSLVQDWLLDNPRVSECPLPASDNPTLLAVAAGLVELFCERLRQIAPAWCAGVGGLSQELYLVKSAEQMPRLRRLCEDAGPASLRRRNIFAPPDFLLFA